MTKPEASEFTQGLTAATNELTAWLDTHPGVQLSDKVLDELWDIVYHVTGRARPTASWNPGTWTRYQAVNR